MRPRATLVAVSLLVVMGLLAGCGGGGSSSHPRGYFGYFPEPDDTDLPRDAIFAVSAPEFAVDHMRLYRWRDRDDDLHAYGDEMTRVNGKRYYDLSTGEHILVPGNYLQAFARYLLVVDYSDGLRRIWGMETGDWVSGRSTDDGPRRWSAPSDDAQSPGAPTKKSWRVQ
ncbi:MAG: hypothetical protein ACE5JM_02205 [Armatimonadota bacterium]